MPAFLMKIRHTDKGKNLPGVASPYPFPADCLWRRWQSTEIQAGKPSETPHTRHFLSPAARADRAGKSTCGLWRLSSAAERRTVAPSEATVPRAAADRRKSEREREKEIENTVKRECFSVCSWKRKKVRLTWDRFCKFTMSVCVCERERKVWGWLFCVYVGVGGCVGGRLVSVSERETDRDRKREICFECLCESVGGCFVFVYVCLGGEV